METAPSSNDPVQENERLSLRLAELEHLESRCRVAENEAREKEKLLEERIKRFQLLKDFHESIAVAYDLQTIYQNLYDVFGKYSRALHVNRVSILLYDQKTNSLISDQLIGVLHRGENLVSAAQPVGYSISGQCLMTASPIVVNDCSKTDLIPEKYISQLSLKSTVAVPIMFRGNVIGVLRVDNTEQINSFTEADVDFLTMIAENLGASIINTTLVVESRLAKDEMEKGRAGFQSIVEKNTEGIIILDRKGMIQYINPAAGAFLGENIGDLSSILSPGLSELVKCWEIPIFIPGGGRGTGEVHVTDSQWEGAPAFLFMLRDVTLRKAEEHVRTVFTRLTNRLVECTAMEEITRIIREESLDLFQWDAYYFAWRHPYDDFFLVPELYDTFDGERRCVGSRKWPLTRNSKEIRVVLRNKPELINLEPQSGSVAEIPFGDETRKSASLMYAPLRKGDSIIGVISVQSYVLNFFNEDHLAALCQFSDIVATGMTRYFAEEALAHINSELGRSNTELQQFAYVASHDLQEPLRKIEAFGERLQQVCGDQLSEKGAEYMGRMMNATQRMRRLINDLLSYSRVATQTQPMTLIDLGGVLRDVLLDLEVRIQNSQAQVETGSMPLIEADPMQMRQLFQNMIGNALKFQRPGIPPVIGIRASGMDEPDGPEYPEFTNHAWVRIRISDNGCGFEDKFKERIFEVFQRLHGRNEYEGSGIGLAICRRIVERHHGKIEAASAPDQGATFTITLPAAQPVQENSVRTV